MNLLSKIAGWMAIAGVLTIGLTMVAFPATVTQLAGIAIAQTATKWNNLKDMAAGDSQTSGAGLMTPCLWNGTSCDRQRGSITNGAVTDVSRISGQITPSDTFVNPTTANTMWTLNGLFEGSTGNWTRQRSVAGSTNTGSVAVGIAYNIPLSQWSRTHVPALASQATASIAAGGGTVRHVATTITVCVATNASTQPPLLFHLRDGATGAGTILRTWALSAPAITSRCENISGLNMTGSANTAMTIENAAGGVAAGAQTTVTMTGYSTP